MNISKINLILILKLKTAITIIVLKLYFSNKRQNQHISRLMITTEYNRIIEE